MTVIPFTGRKPPARPGPAGDARHSLPWTADEAGIIRDAAGTVIGSAVDPDMAALVVQAVNASGDGRE
jgi:hypothetical protein